MSLYKISNDELIDFARKIYEEACGGYLDLKDVTCNRLVREFVDGRQIFEKELDSESTTAGHNWTYTTNNATNFSEDSENVTVYASSDHSISLRDEPSVSPRVEDIVRSDENAFRVNYEGNESERF